MNATPRALAGEPPRLLPAILRAMPAGAALAAYAACDPLAGRWPLTRLQACLNLALPLLPAQPAQPAPAQTAAGWKAVAASVRGAAHIKTGQPCQDAHTWVSDGDWLTAVVSDGAGSAAQAEVGARHVCLSLARNLGLGAQPWRVAGTGGAPDWAGFERALRAAIAAARATLPLGTASISDFHATVVGCVLGPAGGCLFHIGDGAALALRSAGLVTLAHSAPANGASAEITYFYTLDDWAAQLRLTPVPAEADLVLLMSDGAAGFTLASQPGEVEPRFVRPVDAHLAQPGVDAVAGAAALAATLQSPAADRVSTDDKTLLWARRQPAVQPAVLS